MNLTKIHKTKLSNIMIFSFALFVLSVGISRADIWFIDPLNGDDSNIGNREKPLKTLSESAKRFNQIDQPKPVTIKLLPGVYDLQNEVFFKNNISRTQKDRLTIEAFVLPNDPNWNPVLMPVIISTENPRASNNLKQAKSHTETYGFKIKTNFVTIRGIKFLGSPIVNNWYCPIERIGDGLTDLTITECVFIGDKDSLDIYCAALATGDKFVVDHCIFKNCHASVVFWDGKEAIGGKGCAMKYCIVDGCYIASVWTCQTADDFEFSNNIINSNEYFWMRKPGDKITYHIRDCIITSNKYYSGYGVESGAIEQTDSEVTYNETNVTKEGEITLVEDNKSKNYLHPTPDSLGSDLAAGLFTK